MNWQDIWLQLQPHLIEVISVIAAALVAWLSTRVTKWTGLQIEQKYRDALHQALVSGAMMALARGQTREQAAEVAVDHALLSVPDAVKALTKGKPKDVIRKILLNIAFAKLGPVGKILAGG